MPNTEHRTETSYAFRIPVVHCRATQGTGSHRLGRKPFDAKGGVSVRKQELVRAVAQQAQMSESQATTAVNAVLTAIQDALAGGDEVNISGFRVVERASREGRNPRTGTAMTIGPRKSPAFRAGTQLKRAVEGDGRG